MVRRASGLGEAELVAALDEAVRSGMVEEVPAHGLAWRFTHELVRRALYDRLSAVRRAELHLRVGEALEAAEGRSGRALADLAHHFSAAAPFGGAERAVEYNVLAARAAKAALAFGEASDRLRTALGLGIEEPRRARRGAARARRGEQPRRPGAGRAGGVPDGGGHRPRPRRRRAARARRRPATRTPAGARASTTRARSSCSRRRSTALGEEDCGLRVGLLSGLARALDFQGQPRARAWSSGRARSRWRGGWATASALATVLVRSYWSRGDHPARGDPRDADRGPATSRVELGNTEIRAEAMSWRVTAFVALLRPRVGAARGGRRCARSPSRRRSRSSSTWPSTTAPRSRSATGGSRRPRPARAARRNGRAC